MDGFDPQELGDLRSAYPKPVQRRDLNFSPKNIRNRYDSMKTAPATPNDEN
jgi:hypothetical protein